MEYEYGIKRTRYPDSPHRTGMTLKEAERWIEVSTEEGFRADAFYIVRRPKGDWEPVGPLSHDK